MAIVDSFVQNVAVVLCILLVVFQISKLLTLNEESA